MEPLQRGVTAVTRPIGNFLSGLAHVGSLRSDNVSLRQQLVALEEQIRQGAIQQQQLQHMADILKLREILSPPSVGAVVIANGVSNLQWTITLSVGSSDGVVVDDPVVTAGDPTVQAQGVLVGHVVSVSPISCD